MNITDNASVAAQDIFPAPGEGNQHYAWFVNIVARITTASITGTLNIVVRWNDPEVGAVSHTTSILLSVLNNYKQELYTACIAGDINGTIECNVTGLLGTPAFSVDAHLLQLG